MYYTVLQRPGTHFGDGYGTTVMPVSAASIIPTATAAPGVMVAAAPPPPMTPHYSPESYDPFTSSPHWSTFEAPGMAPTDMMVQTQHVNFPGIEDMRHHPAPPPPMPRRRVPWVPLALIAAVAYAAFGRK